MTEQQTLVEFLNACLDEEEEAVKLVRQPYRLYIDGEGVIAEPLIIESPWDDRQGEYEQWSDGEDRLPNRHTYWTLLYDPARVLREVAAKRALLSIHHARNSWGHCMGCGTDSSGSLFMAIDDCPVLRQLTAVYSDHPDYREEWRPQ
jgi:hypothetical protein